MTLEPIICQYATQVGMAGEEDTKHVPRLPFIPVCPPEDRHGAWDGVRFASVCLDAYPCCMADAQQVVDHLEAFLSFWKVGRGDIHDTLELALRVISEESQNWDDASGRDVQSKLILQDRELLDEFGKTLHEV